MVGKFFDPCLNFPTIYTGEQIVNELIISQVGILLYYLKYSIHFLNFKIYCFPLIYRLRKQLKKEKLVQNLS